MWGVGTNLVTGNPQPALDGVYKLSALKSAEGKWQYKLKLSEQLAKISNPGRLQVKRFSQGGEHFADIIYDIDQGINLGLQSVDPFDPTKSIHISEDFESKDLLVPIFREGVQVYTSPSLQEIRSEARLEIQKLPVGVKRFLNPHLYPVGMQKDLYDRKVELIKKVRSGINR